MKKIFSYNRESFDNILDDPHSKVWRFFDRIILGLVMLFPFVLIFESVWNNASLFSSQLFYFDAFISTAFLLEYIYRFLRCKNKLHFLVSPIRIIDLLSFLPFFLWFLAAWDILRTLKILRALRILRLVKRIPMTAGFIKSLKDYADEYRAVFTLYFIILFLGSFFVYYVEMNLVWTAFKTIPDALWWGLVTMTTVWYWDITPVSDLWKMVWSLLVFLWPLMWALTWAVTIMVFMETSRNEMQKNHNRWKECSRCKSKNQKDANYCSKCWEEYIVIRHQKVNSWIIM